MAEEEKIHYGLGQHPNSLKNLEHKFGHDQDRVQASINGKKGAEKAAEARRKRKRMTDAMKWLLSSKDIIKDKDVNERLVELGILQEGDATNAEVLAMVALRKAAKGDVEALKFVRDTGGEAPKNQVELSGDLDRPVATLDLRNLSEEELLRLAEARSPESGADEA